MVLGSWEISMTADIKNSELVVDFILGILDTVSCTLVVKNQIITAVEELYGNIAKYAYGEKVGMVTISCALEHKKRYVFIQFLDSGKPFNPLEYGEPDIKLGIRERKVGGLGIFIVKKSVDKFLYNYTGGNNIVTIIKKIA